MVEMKNKNYVFRKFINIQLFSIKINLIFWILMLFTICSVLISDYIEVGLYRKHFFIITFGNIYYPIVLYFLTVFTGGYIVFLSKLENAYKISKHFGLLIWAIVSIECLNVYMLQDYYFGGDGVVTSYPKIFKFSKDVFFFLSLAVLIIMGLIMRFFWNKLVSKHLLPFIKK
jgi:hypothetical protein